jgi:hypothetical protein
MDSGVTVHVELVQKPNLDIRVQVLLEALERAHEGLRVGVRFRIEF